MLDVLIVARPGDEHGDAVEQALQGAGASVGRASLNSARRDLLRWKPPHDLRIDTVDAQLEFSQRSTIWWRRPGWVELDDLSSEESELVEAEVATIFSGALLSLEARWVDHPHTVQLAENKLYQLAVAKRVGVRVPDSLVTNSVDEARAFTNSRSIVAKAVSSGRGIAPFVDRVSAEWLESVSAAPVLLQESVEATADLRVVTVDEAAFVWSRTRRADEAIDWRQNDPYGSSFSPMKDHPVGASAIRLAKAMGLTHSSQDWLETDTGEVFLEMNPGGQWLFMDDANSKVVPVLVSHLLGSTVP